MLHDGCDTVLEVFTCNVAVLVLTNKGRSLAGSIVCAYMLRQNSQLTVEDAVQKIRFLVFSAKPHGKARHPDWMFVCVFSFCSG